MAETSEQIAARLAAMQREREGIVARVNIAKEGGVDPVGSSADVLADRLKHVDAEIKKAKKDLGQADKDVEAEEPDSE